MHSFKQLESVIDISLQPGTNGNVFAAICCDDAFRLFDMRKSGSGELYLKKTQNIFFYEQYF